MRKNKEREIDQIAASENSGISSKKIIWWIYDMKECPGHGAIYVKEQVK